MTKEYGKEDEKLPSPILDSILTKKEKKRGKRSTPRIENNDLINVNTVMNTVNIALLCIFTVIMCGYLNYIDKENIKVRTKKHEQVISQINKKHMFMTERIQEFHDHHREIYERLKQETRGKFDMMITVFQEICKNTRLNTPYPMRLTKGHTNEDFDNMVRITHWNGQWRDDNNTSLSPSAFLQCPRDLPKPMHYKEWQRLARLFYEESGMNLFIPDYAGEGVMENPTYPVLDVDQLDEQQLCCTPVCFNPDLKYEGKESKCQYCMQVCCNCVNCNRYRAFFKIRTTLINTGKIDSWDYYNQQLLKSINLHNKQRKEKKTLENIMKVLYQQARERKPMLPTRLIYVDDDDPLKEKLRNVALRIMNSPVDKIITADERMNRIADNLSEEIVQHFLETKELQRTRTQDILKWLLEQYHEEEELTKGGSDVVVKFDHNMYQRSSSQETEVDSIITLPQWINSNSDEDQNVSMENDYESVD